MFEKTFIDDCLNGDANVTDIDQYIEYWHTHELTNTLQEFLGLNDYEFEVWCKNSDNILRDILRCRIDSIDFKTYRQMSPDEKIAARSYDIEAIAKLKDEIKHE